jgi:hypothetical protein
MPDSPSLILFPDPPTLCRRAEGLLREIAGADLGDRPLYILAQSMVKGPLRQQPMYGFTSEILSEFVRPFVEWRGPGPAMMINDLQIQADFTPHTAAALQEWGGDAERAQAWTEFMDGTAIFLAIAIHEMAHVVGSHREILEPRAQVTHALSLPKMISLLRLLGEQKRTPEVRTAIQDTHNFPFIRALLHLYWRFCRRRFSRFDPPIGAVNFWVGPTCELSPFEDYLAAIGGEPERLIDQSIGEILSSPAPGPLVLLYGNDLVRRGDTLERVWKRDLDSHPAERPTAPKRALAAIET